MIDAARYDAILEAGRLPLAPCPVCTGDDSAPPCGEDCAHIVKLAAAKRNIRGLYAACWHALRFARVYYSIHGAEDYRVTAVIRQVRHNRVDIAALRAA